MEDHTCAQRPHFFGHYHIHTLFYQGIIVAMNHIVAAFCKQSQHGRHMVYAQIEPQSLLFAPPWNGQTQLMDALPDEFGLSICY